MTEYTIRAEEVIQGDVHSGDLVRVRLKGGRFIFDDGTTAEVKAPRTLPLVQSHRYLVYGTFDPVTSTYYATGGGQGVFELDSNSDRVTPHADSRVDELAKKANQSQAELLHEARASAKPKSP